MRNPNRTTKPERRLIRRRNPTMSRILGVAQAARWHREGILLDEARGFDNILNDLKYGTVPLDLNDRITAALDAQRDALERKLGVGPGMLTPTSSNVNHHGTHTGYEVSAGPNPHITLKYPPHISLGGGGFANIDPSLILGEHQAYRAGHDPNEVAAVHAEAIENALNDDIDRRWE